MPRIPKNRPTRRLTLDLSEEVRTNLEALRETTQADSLVEVIRRALAVYDFVAKAKATGGKLILKDEEGEHSIIIT